MNGTRAVVVAFLLCLAPLGGISAGALQTDNGTMSVVPEENTSEYLTPPSDGIDRSDQQTVGIDAAAAVSANAGEVRTTYYRVSLQRAYREATTREERRAIVRNGTRRLVERVDRLKQSERRAVERYGGGSVGDTELFRRLAVVDRKARTTKATVNWLDTRADNLGMDNTEEVIALQRTRLRTMQGPVRASADEAIGGDSSARVHVDASEDGLVLATVEGTNGDVVYVREAYDPSARTDGGDAANGSGLSAAENRLRELYPWVTNNSTPTAVPIGPSDARLWRFTYSHSHGNLETYLDVDTDRIVIERQFKNTEAVPTRTETATDGGLEMTLNRTRAGGPLGVTVTDVTTGDPVDAEVTLDGKAVGSTESERLWTVAPRGQTTINATYEGETLTHETSFE